MLIHHLSLCESESFVPVGFLSLIESDQPDFFESLIEPESRCFFAESESHDDSESEPCDGLEETYACKLARVNDKGRAWVLHCNATLITPQSTVMTVIPL